MYTSSTFPNLLRDICKKHGERIFLNGLSATRGQIDVTFAELERRSRQVAAGLLNLGLRHGDRIAIAGPNQVEWIELFLGATQAGIIVVLLNQRYRENELEYMMNQSGARLLVTISKTRDFNFETFYSKFRKNIPLVEHIFYFNASESTRDFETLYTESSAAHRSLENIREQSADPVAILYTSGTTGQPKGVTLTHRSIFASARGQVNNHPDISADDVYLGLTPLNHVSGLVTTVTSAMLTASKVVLHEAFSPTNALRAINTQGVTCFGAVPTMWTLMLNDPYIEKTNKDAIRYMWVGGSNVEPTLAKQIMATFPKAKLCNLYGLSEVSGTAVASPINDSLENLIESIGLPIKGVESRIVDLDGKELPFDEEGELQLRGEVVAAGYWEMPEQSAKTFLSDGWLATGDIAKKRPDGHLVILGRKKEMYIQGGYNVYPAEVENVLASHPAVTSAAGIGVPDEILGEVGYYYVVLREEKSISADQLIDYCRQRLADYKVPRKIIFMIELPTTSTGKISKPGLRATLPSEIHGK